MTDSAPIRWGILGTARIARSAFLPALREAGGGIPYAVAGRNLERTRRWAEENGVAHALEGYEALVNDPNVDAVYNPLPNHLHAEWSAAALRAGKAVLCEKPLCTSVSETAWLLDVARQTGSLLWEAFVFPFHAQMDRLRGLIREGILGDIHEVQSAFHFELTDRANIRFSPEMGGGGLLDVGCYPIRLAGLVFDRRPRAGTALADWAPEGVDVEMQGILEYGSEQRLAFSCGMSRHAGDTFSRVLGSRGEVRMSNPFHPRAHDTFELRIPGEEPVVEDAATTQYSFTPAIAHIQAAIAGLESPRHLAVDEAMATAMGLALALESARDGRVASSEDIEGDA